MDLKTFFRVTFLLVVYFELGSSINTDYPQCQPRNLIMRLPTRTRDEIIRIARLHPASVYNHPIFQNPDIFKQILSAYTTIYKHNIQTFIRSNTKNGLEVNRKFFIRSDLVNPQTRVIVEKSSEAHKPTLKTCDSNDPGNDKGNCEGSHNLNIDNENWKCSKYEGVYDGSCGSINTKGIDNSGHRTKSNHDGSESVYENHNKTCSCEVEDYSSSVQLHVQIKDKLLRRIKKITKDLDQWNPELVEGIAGPVYEKCGYINKLRLIGLSLIDLGNFLLDDNPGKELCVIVGDDLDGDAGLYPPGCFKI